MLGSKSGGRTAPLTRMGLPTSKCACSSLPMGLSLRHSVVPSPCLSLQAQGVRLGKDHCPDLQHCRNRGPLARAYMHNSIGAGSWGPTWPNTCVEVMGCSSRSLAWPDEV